MNSSHKVLLKIEADLEKHPLNTWKATTKEAERSSSMGRLPYKSFVYTHPEGRYVIECIPVILHEPFTAKISLPDIDALLLPPERKEIYRLFQLPLIVKAEKENSILALFLNS